ncbi:tRNA glutamyl-Q(34) synthetase GluQRS [Motiliproteus sp. SC1-56]|uniref:tRNA glutamyl-Q(34) synthetase GluQRS n=1 Tax=Motiliproteus sp. SC1-56 TaxID=2799565 RepID=UPI001A8C8CE1|nr:tRNA glutamyl-Q(34) synthetase GluQRS [Motiliproteus sp. SC1-56]
MLPPEQSPYRGRFAPSPTGALHFGSLLAALASFLDARHHRGRWLVRIEDLDPPREVPGAADAILRTLEQFHLHWDEEVIYQSQRQADYEALVQTLLRRNQAYYCDCSRQQSARRGPVYDGYCRRRQAVVRRPAAVRLRTDPRLIRFQDAVQGAQQERLDHASGDFIIHRKDQLYAYQLAVVADDAAQGITQVVRGCDLLSSTGRQIHLQQVLGYPVPAYTHIPVLVNAAGQKLSKQTFATALSPRQPGRDLYRALHLLGQRPPDTLRGAGPAEVLDWAVPNWRRERLPRRRTLPESQLQD